MVEVEDSNYVMGTNFIPSLLVKGLLKQQRNLLIIFGLVSTLGGAVFVIGHYVFNPPNCTEQAARTCNCPLW